MKTYGGRRIKSLDEVRGSEELKALQAEKMPPSKMRQWEEERKARKKEEAKRKRQALREAERMAAKRAREEARVHIGPNGGKYRVVKGRKRYDVA
jgi:hypothetical protein